MIVDGKYECNITCSLCKHRHPARLTCREAQLIAENAELRDRIETLEMEAIVDEARRSVGL